MADNIIGNMFNVDPDQLRQQRMQNLYTQSMQTAQLDPFQRANQAIMQGAGGAAMLGAQALGMKTQEERLAETRQQALQGFDPSNKESMMRTIQGLHQAGDTQGAMMLAQHAREIEKQQIEEEYKKAQTQKIQDAPLKLEWIPHPTDPDLELKAMWSPELQDYVPLEGSRAATRTRAGSGGGATKPIVSTSATGDVTILDPSGKKVIARHEGIGKPTATTEKDWKLTPIMQQGLDAVNDALSLADKGIYTGAYANISKGAVKYTPGMDKTKVANTEEFLASVGNIIVPRLQEFGGSDSNEELKYLQKISAGDITLEKAAIKKILTSAKNKMDAEIKRRLAGGKPTFPTTSTTTQTGWSAKIKG